MGPGNNPGACLDDKALLYNKLVPRPFLTNISSISEMSSLLASQFENKDVITHRGGHYFPATAEQKQKYIEYFQDRLQSYLEAKVLKSSNPADEICLEEQSDDDESD